MEEQKQGGPSSFSCAIINARRHLEPGVQVLEGNLFFGLRKVSRGREWGITVCRETFPRRQSVPEISKAGAWRGRGCGRRGAAGVSPSSRDPGGEKKAEVSTEWAAAFEAREQNEPVGQRGGRGSGGAPEVRWTSTTSTSSSTPVVTVARGHIEAGLRL